MEWLKKRDGWLQEGWMDNKRYGWITREWVDKREMSG
jgi:hypothetical protein